MDDEIQFKKCPDCGKVLPLTDFQKRKKSLDGRTASCKKCIYAKGHQGRIPGEKHKAPKWKPYGWLGEYLGYKHLAECIIVTEKKGKK